MARGVFKEYKGKGLEEGLQNLWQELLERGVVKAILVPMEMEGGLVAPGILSDPKRAGESRALAPYMPVNAARVLQMMTKTMPPSDKLAVVLRSCEARALVELVKLKQISQENLIVISIDCAGTYSVEEYKKLLAGKGDPGARLRGTSEDRGSVADGRRGLRAGLLDVASQRGTAGGRDPRTGPLLPGERRPADAGFHAPAAGAAHDGG